VDGSHSFPACTALQDIKEGSGPLAEAGKTCVVDWAGYTIGGVGPVRGLVCCKCRRGGCTCGRGSGKSQQGGQTITGALAVCAVPVHFVGEWAQGRSGLTGHSLCLLQLQLCEVTAPVRCENEQAHSRAGWPEVHWVYFIAQHTCTNGACSHAQLHIP